MKKFFAIALSLLLLIGAVAVFAEQPVNVPENNDAVIENNDAITEDSDATTEIEPLNGYITEIFEDGSFKIVDQFGREVVVKLDEESIIDRAEEKLEVGMFVFVDYDGIMTRSLPAQITADRVFGAVIEGEVTAVEGLAVTINSETHGEVIVNLTEDMAVPFVGEVIRVHFTGAMTMSLPAQIGAVVFEIVPPEHARV